MEMANKDQCPQTAKLTTDSDKLKRKDKTLQWLTKIFEFKSYKY